MRTFTYSDAKSYKFWNIELQGSSLTVTYGRQGSAGQTQTKTFPGAAAAQKEHDKLVKEKLAKGYVETTAGARPAAGSLREALEQALVDNPDDVGAHAAYADHLQEQGDPRGEFISVQLALEDPAKSTRERKALQQREKALLKAHEREWLGELAEHLLGEWPEGDYLYSFRRGWLDRLQASPLAFDGARVLARAPEARLLRELVIEGLSGDDPDDPGDVKLPEFYVEPDLYPLVRARTLGNVRLLQIGVKEGPRDHPNSNIADGGAVAGIVKLMPKIEELYLLAQGVDTDQLFALPTLGNLRVLQVYHNDRYPLQKLAKNSSLGKLTHLLLFPHSIDSMSEEDPGPSIRLDGVRALLRSPAAAHLTHLLIRASDLGDPGCAEVVKSGIPKHLKVLDLRLGRVTDAGAQTLAVCPDLKNLESLDVSINSLTNAGVKALKATGIKVLAEGQWKSSGDEEADYEQYLYWGDIE
jgi:uncharacterized protein (TIGR02996 family)